MRLEPELLNASKRLLNYLKTMREKDAITPTTPISSVALVEVAKKSGVKLSRENIYHIVHYLREQNEPIASGQFGYFYAIEPEELKWAICEQMKIIRERQETLTLLKRIQDNLRKSTNSLFPTPAAEVLKNSLELEKINLTTMD